MYNIHRKSNLARHLNNLRAIFPKEYDFYPKTWVLPSDVNKIKREIQGPLNFKLLTIANMGDRIKRKKMSKFVFFEFLEKLDFEDNK